MISGNNSDIHFNLIAEYINNNTVRYWWPFTKSNIVFIAVEASVEPAMTFYNTITEEWFTNVPQFLGTILLKFGIQLKLLLID